jgi:hypothetical protein
MGLDDEGRGNPTSVILGSNSPGKSTASFCLASVNRVYILASLVKWMKREVLVNKGVSILKAEKKSNKQSIFRRAGKGKSCGMQVNEMFSFLTNGV